MNIDVDRRLGQLRRATVARSALDVIALIFLACSFIFWSVAFVQLLAPPRLVDLLTLQAGVLALVYALAAPLLISALVPTTPAGQLLQKTQWRTFGFAAVVAAALFLAYQGEWMLESWLVSQPGIREAGMQRSLAISLSIAFVLIPALAWTQLTPERWLAQIQQAHQVKKLEMQQSGEIAIIKARLLWAEQKAALSYANLLPAEQREIRDTLQGLLMGIADTQRGIARTLGISAEIERAYPTLDDRTIADAMEHIAGVLDVPARELEREITSSTRPQEPAAPLPAPHEDSRLQSSIPRVQPHVSNAEPTPPHEDSRLQSSIPRAWASDTGGQGPTLSDSVARRIAAELPRVFTAQNLADLVQQDKRSAQRTIAIWLEERLITQVQLGRYMLTERAEVQR